MPVGDDLRGLFGGIHVGDDDPLGTAVENAGGVVVLEPRHPDDGRDPGVPGGDADLHRRIDRHGVVLGVDEQPVEATGLHDPADIGGARLAQAYAKRQLAGIQALQGDVAQ